jgi:Gas vesicle synthesis protein GvpL/GvpF
VLAVHGLIRAADRAAVDDLPPEPVTAWSVARGELAAVVSAVPEEGLTPEDAVPHLDLLVALVAQVPVLPLAFGAVAPEEDAVRDELLAPGAERHLRQLDALRDLVELRLGLTFDADVAAAAASREPDVAALARTARAPGAGLAQQLALGEAVAQRVAERRDALTDEWTGELVGTADRAVVLSADEQEVRIALLVRRDRLPAADDAVERLRRAAAGQAEVEYVGPLPVYSFLDEVDTAASPPRTSRWGW